MRVFITGADGYIGAWLVRRALVEGAEVVAATRTGSMKPIPGAGEPAIFTAPKLTVVEVDVRVAGTLPGPLNDVTHVFHLAGLTKPWAKDPREFHRLNVEGTCNVLDAARDAGVQRVVYTSSAVTLGTTPPGAIHNEETPRASKDFLHLYEATKFEAERLALDRADSGQEVVAVLPTRVYGPGHLTISNALPALINDYLSGRMPIILNGGRNIGNYAYVHDVVDGHWRAMFQGKPGERYLLGGDNISLLQLTDMIDQMSGRKHLRINVGRAMPMALAQLSVAGAKIFGIEPLITPGFMRMYLSDGAYDSGKAIRELGYSPTAFQVGLQATFDWLGEVKPTRDHKRLAESTQKPPS